MGLGDRTAPRGRTATRGVARARRPLTASEAAWLALVPCALVTIAAMLLLGPPLGTLLPSQRLSPWPSALQYFRPEPTEQARYLIALAGPLLLAAAIAYATRRAPQVGPAVARWVVGVQALGAAILVMCFVVQWRTTFDELHGIGGATSTRTVYFTVPTLVAASAIAAFTAIGIRAARVRPVVGALLRESPRRRAICWAVVVLAVVVSVLPALNGEHTIMRAPISTLYHLPFPLDETFAVLDGRSPLVDFAAQYGSLWPYALAALMRVFGESVEAFTVLAALVTALALSAVFAVLRRVVASAPAALLLFLPLLATSFFIMGGTVVARYSLVTLPSVFPLRFAAPLLLLWLTARHLDGAWPRARWLLFAAGGLAVLNNADFGVPALGATIAALLWVDRPSQRSVAVLAGELAAGLLAAYAAVAALTLVRAGALPDLGLLFRYVRLFTATGYNQLPLSPLIGVSTAIYLTYVAAIGTATVRALDGATDRLLTGLLAWSGVFGLGIGAYYMGRSHPQVLVNMFPAWALSLVLLVTVAARRIAARPSRLPSPAEVACLVGFGLLVCSLAQTPAPWTQVQRLQQTTTRTYAKPGAEAFVNAHARDGEAVLILSSLGHRIAAWTGVRNVFPYTGEDSIPTREQLDETLDVLRREGGHTVFLPLAEAWPEIHETIEARGFRLITYDRRADLVAFTDREDP